MPTANSTNTTDNLELVCAHDHPAEPVTWLWPEKIPIGKVSMLIGDPGTGKTLAALDLAARLSCGNACPKTNNAAKTTSNHSSFDIRHSSFPPADNPQSAVSATPPSPFRLPPSSTIILSATDDLADTLRPRLDAAGADPRRIFVIPSIADLRHDFAQLRAAVDRAPNCRLTIIDPINAYVGPSDSHFQTVLRKVLEPLAKLAAEKRIAVLAIANLRKNEGAAIYRAAGSMGFVAAARTVWTICRDQSNPTRTLMLPVKNNLAPTATGLAFTIKSHPETGAPVIAWSPDPVISSADEALTRAEIADLNSARQWLTKALAGGPRSASEIADEGSQYGFHERTLRRALHAIGGNTQNRGIVWGWWWSLPAAPNQETQTAPGSAGGSSNPDVAPTSTPGGAGGCPTKLSVDQTGPMSMHPQDPQNPVPSCPLPEIFNTPPSSAHTNHDAPSRPSPPPTADSSASPKLLDRLRREDARANPTKPRQQPKPTGVSVGDMLKMLHDELQRREINDSRNPKPPDERNPRVAGATPQCAKLE
jgi:hypothetical protein